MLPFHLRTLTIIITSLALIGCASTSSQKTPYKLSADGYATQKKAPRQAIDKTQIHSIIEFPTRQTTQNPLPLTDPTAFQTKLFNALITQSYGGSFDGQLVEVGLRTTESEFDPATLPAEYRDHPNIRYKFLPEAFREPPVAPKLAPLIRGFEVDPIYQDIVRTSLTTGYLRLEDGCIYFGKKSRKAALAFPLNAGLRPGADGYIEVYDRIRPTAPGARLGQNMGWGNGSRNISDTSEGQSLIQACGAETALLIGLPSPYPFDR